MIQQLISSYSNSGRATFAAVGTSTRGGDWGICGTSTCCGLSGGEEEGSPSRMASRRASRSAVGLDKAASPCLFGSMPPWRSNRAGLRCGFRIEPCADPQCAYIMERAIETPCGPRLEARPCPPGSGGGLSLANLREPDKSTKGESLNDNGY